MEDKVEAGYHTVTRWLHAGLVLGVIFQLTCAALMAHPDHKDEGHNRHASDHASVTVVMTDPEHKNAEQGQFFMQMHRMGGIVLAAIVFANLMWAVLLRGNPRKRQLAVLFSMRHWREALSIAKNIPLIILKKRHMAEPGNALSLVFEMLGMLIISVVALTGSIIWRLWEGPGNNVSSQAEALMATHSVFAVFLLLYLLGHVSMAFLHARAGDAVFARIIPLRKKTEC